MKGYTPGIPSGPYAYSGLIVNLERSPTLIWKERKEGRKRVKNWIADEDESNGCFDWTSEEDTSKTPSSHPWITLPLPIWNCRFVFPQKYRVFMLRNSNAASKIIQVVPYFEGASLGARAVKASSIEKSSSVVNCDGSGKKGFVRFENGTPTPMN